VKKLIKKIINLKSQFVVKYLIKYKFFRFILYSLTRNIFNEKKTVSRNEIKLKFYIPNELTLFRINTFSTKEPETLDWIDKFQEKSIFYDVGANVGLYSCYAAKKKQCNTFAFEPSVFNLEILAKNIFLNNLESNIKIIPLLITSKKGIGDFNLSSTEWGGASSSFNEDFTFGGSILKKVFNYKTLALTLDECLKIFNFPQPNYLKIDVDGIEHLILEGSNHVLKNIKSILVEIDDRFEEQKLKTIQILKNNEFELKVKTHSEMFANTESSQCFNQIWEKK